MAWASEFQLQPKSSLKATPDLFGFFVHKRMEHIKFKPLSQEIHLNWMAGASFVSQWVKLNNMYTLEGRELPLFF